MMGHMVVGQVTLWQRVHHPSTLFILQRLPWYAQFWHCPRLFTPPRAHLLRPRLCYHWWCLHRHCLFRGNCLWRHSLHCVVIPISIPSRMVSVENFSGIHMWGVYLLSGLITFHQWDIEDEPCSSHRSATKLPSQEARRTPLYMPEMIGNVKSLSSNPRSRRNINISANLSVNQRRNLVGTIKVTSSWCCDARPGKTEHDAVRVQIWNKT